jgi:hypothetical protein
MAKPEISEALDAWRKAEQRYQDAVAPFLSGQRDKLRKDDAVSITKARVRADRKLQTYLDRTLS